MCLIVFAFQTHPNYDLIMAANRDEAYRRPTHAAQFWNTDPTFLAGKDLKAGGTWMGINKKGAFAALTNYRDPSITKDEPPSRGLLVHNFLTKNTNPETYLKSLDQKADHFMGFNLLLGTPKEMYHYSNQEQQINRIEPGIHALSNHLLDSPWPKVERAKKELKEIISIPFSEKAFFELLKDDKLAPDNQLPNTGIDKEIEKQVSPIFIKSEDYGTRNSTLLLINKAGKVTFEERRYKTGTQKVEEKNRYEFMIEEKV